MLSSTAFLAATTATLGAAVPALPLSSPPPPETVRARLPIAQRVPQNALLVGRQAVAPLLEQDDRGGSLVDAPSDPPQLRPSVRACKHLPAPTPQRLADHVGVDVHLLLARHLPQVQAPPCALRREAQLLALLPREVIGDRARDVQHRAAYPPPPDVVKRARKDRRRALRRQLWPERLHRLTAAGEHLLDVTSPLHTQAPPCKQPVVVEVHWRVHYVPLPNERQRERNRSQVPVVGAADRLFHGPRQRLHLLRLRVLHDASVKAGWQKQHARQLRLSPKRDWEPRQPPGHLLRPPDPSLHDRQSGELPNLLTVREEVKCCVDWLVGCQISCTGHPAVFQGPVRSSVAHDDVDS